ncbi:MAG: hypothetical protein K2W96_05295, partial [Gemmataceae bacterium]|nr:hypothetical protein [Gemmataceae bacterium]
GSPRVVAGLAGAAVLASSLVAGGLAWRVYGVPYHPEPEGLASLKERLEAADKETGSLIRRALGAMHRGGDRSAAMLGASALLHEGRKPDQQSLDAFDQALAGKWRELLKEASRRPLGTVEELRRAVIETDLERLGHAVDAASLLAADGLRAQSERDDPSLFLARLETGLALARNLRNGADLLTAGVGQMVEEVCLDALPRWLGRLEGRADLLTRSAAALEKHERELPPDLTLAANYLVALTRLEEPGASRVPDTLEGMLVALAVHVPWEKARLQRKLRCRASSGSPNIEEYDPTIGVEAIQRPLNEPRSAFKRAMARLMVALRRYEEKHKNPAPTLAALVPDWIAEVPADPFGGAIRYRVSEGEKLPGKPGREVKKGQGVLWSESGKVTVIVPRP